MFVRKFPWARAKLADLMREGCANGISVRGSDDPPGVPSLKLDALTDCGIDVTRVRYIDISRGRQEALALRVGDFLVSRGNGSLRLLARCCVVTHDLNGTVFPDTIIRFRFDTTKVDLQYLKWFWRTEALRDQIAARAKTTAGIWKVSQGDLASIEVPLPPLAEQHQIVAQIEALSARTRRARDDLKRIAPLSDRHRLASLRAGVTGQLTEAWRRTRPVEDVRIALRRIPAPEQGRGGREATTDVIPGMAALSVNDPNTLAPPGWAWTSLLRVARQETGHTPSRRVASYWDGGNVPWVGIRDAGTHHGLTIYNTMQKCTEIGLANSSARLLPASTVCLSRTASVGYVTVLGKPMATSQDFATWTCTPALLPEYLKFALLAEGDDIRRFGEGSTHTTIYFPEIRALHICLPPIEEQAEIVRILSANASSQIIVSIETERTLFLLDRLEQGMLTHAFRSEFVADDRSAEGGPVSGTSEKRRRGGRAVA